MCSYHLAEKFVDFVGDSFIMLIKYLLINCVKGRMAKIKCDKYSLFNNSNGTFFYRIIILYA